PCHLVLVARDKAKASRIAADLAVRGPGSPTAVVETDSLDAARFAGLAVETSSPPIDIVMVAQGMLPEQSQCEHDLALCRDTLEVNAVSPALFAEAFAGQLAKAGRGTLAIIGSVAGDRGRKANYTYGACKALVARYAEGLEHRFAGTGVSVVLIKPGPTDTPMAAAQRAKGRSLAPVENVARATVRGIQARRSLVYP